MHYTTFDRKLWDIKDFDRVGYDKTSMTFEIRFLSGEVRKHNKVPEETIFEFIIASDKEAFYRNEILQNFP